MFDVGFLELILISVVALLVLGPERLPGAIRTGSLWLGRLKRSFNQIKMEVEKELNTDEIKQQLHNESVLGEIEKANQTIKNELNAVTEDIEKQTEKALGNDINQADNAPKKAAE